MVLKLSLPPVASDKPMVWISDSVTEIRTSLAELAESRGFAAREFFTLHGMEQVLRSGVSMERVPHVVICGQEQSPIQLFLSLRALAARLGAGSRFPRVTLLDNSDRLPARFWVHEFEVRRVRRPTALSEVDQVLAEAVEEDRDGRNGATRTHYDFDGRRIAESVTEMSRGVTRWTVFGGADMTWLEAETRKVRKGGWELVAWREWETPADLVQAGGVRYN